MYSILFIPNESYSKSKARIELEVLPAKQKKTAF